MKRYHGMFLIVARIMFSTLLDCRQSFSEVSLCFFSTRLRGDRLGCTAFVLQASTGFKHRIRRL